MANLVQRIKNVLRPFKRIRKEITQSIALEQFCYNQVVCNCDYIDFSENNFLLFDYPYYNVFACGNLGDEIQSIATKNAIDSIYKGANYEYFGRDYLAYYNGALSQNRGGGTPIANRNV